MRKLFIIFLLLFVCLVTSCSMPVAKQLIRSLPDISGDDYGTVYLFRPTSYVGIVLKGIVYLDDFIVDEISNGTYKIYKLPPGEHSMYVSFGAYSTNRVKFTLKKGDIFYYKVKQDVDALLGIIYLEVITKEKANKLLKAYKHGYRKPKYSKERYPVLR